MKSEFWFDLSAHGLELLTLRVPSGKVYVGIRAPAKGDALALAAAAPMAFKAAPGNPALMIREVSVGRDGTISWPFDPRALTRTYPDAKPATFDPARHLRDQSRSAPASAASPQASSTPATSGAPLRDGRPLGPNSLGYSVYETPEGVRYAVDDRKAVVSEEGAPEEQRGNFLRATRPDGSIDPDALLRCAQGFVESAVRGRTMGAEDLTRFVATTMGDAPGGREAALPAIATAASMHIARRGGRTLREAFIAGYKLSDTLPVILGSASSPLPLAAAAQRLLGLVSDTGALVVAVDGPGAGEYLTHLPKDSTIRIATSDPEAGASAMAVAAAGGLRGVSQSAPGTSDRLILNMPSPAPGQTVDAYLAGIETSLAQRNPDGIAVVVLDEPTTPEGADALSRLRDRLAIGYAFEAEARIDGELTGGSPRLMLSIGARRGEPDESALPPRAWEVDDWSSLWTWTAETVSARAKASQATVAAAGAVLQEGGRTVAVSNPFQTPYVSASRVGTPKSMVPRNLEGATREALGRAAAAGGGDIDAWVAREFGYKVEDLGRLFSPEQVDALGLYLHCEMRGRGFLDADQTGIGKGRVLAAILRRAVLKDEKALFLTERQVNLSDIWRDIIHIESADLFKPLVVNDGVQIIDERTKSVVFGSAPRAQVDAMLDSDAWPEGVNLVMGTYSQFSREVGTNPDSASSDRSLSGRKAQWLSRAVERDVHLVADECHNASSMTSRTSENVSAAVKKAHPSTVYSSATFAKDADHMAFYAPLFPDGVSTAELEGMMHTGGEAFQEVLSWMLAHDGVMIRREFDLSRVTYQTVVDTPRFDRNRSYMDAVAPILADLVKLSGDVDSLLRRQNAGGDDAAAARAERDESRRKVKPFHLTRTGFGSPLYNISRLFVAALKTDAAVEDALQALQENKKPVIMVENTVQSLLEELSGSTASAEGSLVPDFRALFHRTMRQMTTARWYDEKNVQHLRDMSESDPAMKARIDRLSALIDKLPVLPVSSIDEVKRRIREAGWSIEEITGRDIEVTDGRVMRRPPTNPTVVKNAFNSGDLDALIINVAGSTGIDLHASGRFADQRKRRLIELQAPADILRKMQSHGRVNRYDQVEDPEIVNIVSGLPIEMRLIAMENAKVRRMSANTTSNRDAAILTRDIPDLINPIGDMVCARYAEARPDLMRRLGFKVEEVVRASNENMEQEQAGADVVRSTMIALRKGPASKDKDGVENRDAREKREMGERKAREGGFQVKDSKRTANEILARVIMLPTSLQEQVCRELTAEFNAAVEEMEANGETPLRASELPGVVHERIRTVFDGGEGDGATSVFHEPLYVLEGAVKQTGKPLRIDDLMDRIQIGDMASGRARACIDRLRGGVEEILKPFLPEGCLSVADALVRESTRERKDVTQRKARLEFLAEVLEQLRPGSEVNYRIDGEMVKGIVTRVEYPERGYEHVHGGYGVEFVLPGDEKPRTMRLATLTRDPEFKVGEGLKGRDYDNILKTFDSVEKTKLNPVHILTHNVYRAVRLNWEHRLGRLQTFVAKDGTRHRGVVLSKKNFSLSNVPVELSDAGMAWEALSGRKALVVGNATLADKTFSLMPIDGGSRYEVRLPKKTSKAHGYIYDHDVVAAMLRRHVPDAKGSSAKLLVDAGEARRLVDALYESGARFWCNSLERKWAQEYRRSNPLEDRRAAEAQARDDEPGPIGMVA